MRTVIIKISDEKTLEKVLEKAELTLTADLKKTLETIEYPVGVSIASKDSFGIVTEFYYEKFKGEAYNIIHATDVLTGDVDVYSKPKKISAKAKKPIIKNKAKAKEKDLLNDQDEKKAEITKNIANNKKKEDFINAIMKMGLDIPGQLEDLSVSELRKVYKSGKKMMTPSII